MDQESDTSSDLIKVVLPANLIAQIDAQVGSTFVDREDFIRSAVRRYLEYLQSVSTGRDDELR